MNAFMVHHFYYGLIILFIGFILIFKRNNRKQYITGIILCTLGLWITTDDVVQHIVQIWHPEYHSFLHRFYIDTFYNIEWIRNFNDWLDGVLK